MNSGPTSMLNVGSGLNVNRHLALPRPRPVRPGLVAPVDRPDHRLALVAFDAPPIDRREPRRPHHRPAARQPVAVDPAAGVRRHARPTSSCAASRRTARSTRRPSCRPRSSRCSTSRRTAAGSRLKRSGVGFSNTSAACPPMRSAFVTYPTSFTSKPGLTAQNDALGLMPPLFLLKSLWRFQPDSDVGRRVEREVRRVRPLVVARRRSLQPRDRRRAIRRRGCPRGCPSTT